MFDHPKGQMSSYIELIDGQLYQTLVFDELDVKAVRVLERVN